MSPRRHAWAAFEIAKVDTVDSMAETNLCPNLQSSAFLQYHKVRLMEAVFAMPKTSPTTENVHVLIQGRCLKSLSFVFRMRRGCPAKVFALAF